MPLAKIINIEITQSIAFHDRLSDIFHNFFYILPKGCFMSPVTKVATIAIVAVTLTGVTGCQSTKKMFGKKDDIKIAKAEKTEQGYYQEAKTNLEKGNYNKAIQNLTDLRTFYPVGEYSEQALLDLMYAQFQSNDHLDAVSNAERFIKSYPTDPQIAYAYYMRGVANMTASAGGIMKYTKLNPAHRDMEYSKIAFSNFQELLNKYPNSQYAPDSALRMRYIYNQLAENEMDTARWYIKRKAYLSAVNRAKWVFDYYPQSETIPEAIATMAYGYDKLGMTDTAKQYKQLLEINYPQLLGKNGEVLLNEARTGSNWLSKVTLGVLGQSSTNKSLVQNTQYSGNTKPQIIQQQTIRQASNLQLPKDNAPQEVIQPTDKKVNFGLGLPEEQTN